MLCIGYFIWRIMCINSILNSARSCHQLRISPTSIYSSNSFPRRATTWLSTSWDLGIYLWQQCWYLLSIFRCKSGIFSATILSTARIQSIYSFDSCDCCTLPYFAELKQHASKPIHISHTFFLNGELDRLDSVGVHLYVYWAVS